MRTVLLVLLSCVWLGTGAVAHTTKDVGAYRLRRREGLSPQDIRERNRELNELLPSFSADSSTLVDANLPNVTLLLRGLPGELLGDKSYDAIQTAMNDYLQKSLEEFFGPTRYEFREAESKVTLDEPFQGEGLFGGNSITMETKLKFFDPNYVSSEDNLEIGVRKRINDRPTFRTSDRVPTDPPKPQTRTTSLEAVPSELELEFAAGHAWNDEEDLNSLRNHLLVAATIENLPALSGVQKIETSKKYLTSEPQGEEIALVEEEDEEDQTPDIGDIQSPSGSLNIAAASSALNQNKTERLNPLYPALIVGIAVFLFTIIVLGYRKHKGRGDPFLFSRGRGWRKKQDNVMIHIINDNSTLEGDEEIEVEDTLYTSSPENTPDRKKLQKEKQRELDKEYATSCLKPTALGMASPSPPSTSVSNESEEIDVDAKRSKNCLKVPGRRRRGSKRSLGEQDSMAYSNQAGIRRVDLTAAHGQSTWRNPAELHQEGTLDSGDMTKKERKRFTKYIESGLTVEEASSQIMIERNASSNSKSRFGRKEGPTPPSTMTLTRTGDVGGYTDEYANGHRGNPKEPESVQSNPMACFDPTAIATCGEDTVQTEVMPDGTNVHFTNNYMSLGEACSSNDPNALNGIKKSNSGNSRNARAMVITEASSYASSYDDDEFDRAMAEAEVEIHVT